MEKKACENCGFFQDVLVRNKLCGICHGDYTDAQRLIFGIHLIIEKLEEIRMEI